MFFMKHLSDVEMKHRFGMMALEEKVKAIANGFVLVLLI